MDRRDIESAISSDKLPEGALYSPEIAACYALELQAAIVVSGSIEYTPGKIVLRVNVSPVQAEKGIFGKQIILDRTLTMEGSDGLAGRLKWLHPLAKIKLHGRKVKSHD